jgi:hypothetical protein
MSYHVPIYPVRLPGSGHAVALGGGAGLGRLLVHLFIWRLLWRGGLAIWRVPTFGPAIDIVLGIVVVALIILRSQRGPGWWQRRGGWPGRPRGSGTSDNTETGSRDNAGPRDW